MRGTGGAAAGGVGGGRKGCFCDSGVAIGDALWWLTSLARRQVALSKRPLGALSFVGGLV